MAVYLVATNSAERSELLCDYLAPRVDDADLVHAVNSKRGGDDTTRGDLRRGKEALAVVETRLSQETTVETHQFVRGNDPAEDLLGFADRNGVDELVIGVRNRSVAAKLVFGSVAEDVLLNADRPVRVVPTPEA
ncbi:universal stress protein [Halobaculum sp. P14]|uniref:universal stress protein n=1 Tax=Halobaculum sp. P14 TaxID=3421638 RepID=UPI003EBD9B94